MANQVQVLILGMPGRMQEGLRTLLNAVPEVEVLGADAGYLPLADLGHEQPDLVLLDFGRPTVEVTSELAWVKSRWPSASCLVLADTARQLYAAKAAGADGVLLRGFGVGEFFATLRGLLKDKIYLGAERVLSDGETSDAHQPDENVRRVEGAALMVSPVVF